MRIQGWQWLILLVVVLLLFGAARLPALAQSMTDSLKIFRRGVKDLADDDAPSGATAAGRPASTDRTAGDGATSPPGAAPAHRTPEGDAERQV